jgi:4'-phosphopantetheinyl transferase EntD
MTFGSPTSIAADGVARPGTPGTLDVVAPRPRPSVPPSPLDAALATLAPAEVVTGSRVIAEHDVDALFAVERDAVARAVPSRRAEFASGRALLRALLGDHVAIPVGADRAPIAPDGTCVSLAHDRLVAVAAISRDPSVRSIGIDIEPATPLSADMAAVILRPEEGELDAHLAFTLKEATYKAWSRLGGRMLEFHDVRLRIEDGTFAAEVVPDGVGFSGRFARVDQWWTALVVVTERNRPVARGARTPSKE